MSTRRHLRSMTDEDEFDPYQLEDPSHDPSKFYVYCGKESSPVQARIPTEYMDKIAALVARREIPEYQTPADFIRDAIHHRLYWYSNHYDVPELADQINVFVGIQQSLERQRAMAARKQAIVQYREEFNEALAQRSKGACVAVVEAVDMALDSRDAADDTYKRGLEALKREFAEGIKGW